MRILFLFLVALAAFGQVVDVAPRRNKPILFTDIGTPADGVFLYCSDCTKTNPTTSGGSGAYIFREGGQWNGGAAGSGTSANCNVTATSTVVTLNAPCIVRANDALPVSTGTQTWTKTAGSGDGIARVFLNSQGQAFLAHSTAAGLTFTVSAGATALQQTSPSYGENTWALAEIQVTSGSFGTPVNYGGAAHRDGIQAGTGTTVVDSSGVKVIGIDTAIVPRLGAANTFTGDNDFRNASATAPNKTGASNPATCTVGQTFFNTATPGLVVCTATNTWTAVGGGGGSSAETSIPIFFNNTLGSTVTDPSSGAVFPNLAFTKAQTLRYGWLFRKNSNTVLLKPFFVTDDGSGSTGDVVIRLQLFCVTSSRMGLATQIGSDRDVTVSATAGSFYLPLPAISESFDVSSCSSGSMISATIQRVGASESAQPTQAIRLAGGSYVP